MGLPWQLPSYEKDLLTCMPLIETVLHIPLRSDALQDFITVSTDDFSFPGGSDVMCCHSNMLLFLPRSCEYCEY